MEELFGKGNYKVPRVRHFPAFHRQGYRILMVRQMQNDQWIFEVPRELTDEELKYVNPSFTYV
jgi:hypothetical protein